MYWVDPETGALLNVDEDQKVTLRNPATGATAAVLYSGDLVATPGTVTAQRHPAGRPRGEPAVSPRG